MAFKIFKPESPLMITMTQITDVIFLSLFWLLGCIPVVTAGASFAALYDTVYRTFREGEKNSWSRFWQVYSREWKAGILPGETKDGKAGSSADAVAACAHAVGGYDAVFKRPCDHDGENAQPAAAGVDDVVFLIQTERFLRLADFAHLGAKQRNIPQRHGQNQRKFG